MPPLEQWILPSLLMGLFLFCGIKVTVRRFAPIKSVHAQVVDKFVTETFSKYSGTGVSKRYTVVFLAKGKKKGFHVSEFSYGGYRKGESGTLKYRGDRLIDFH